MSPSTSSGRTEFLSRRHKFNFPFVLSLSKHSFPKLEISNSKLLFMHDLDEDHEHFEIPPDAIVEDIEGLEMFTLKSVGIDIGSSTSHLVFSQLTLRREGASLSGRFKVTDRRVLFRSNIMLTPYLSGTSIDIEKVKRFIEDAY